MSSERLARLDAVMKGFVDRGQTPGVVTLVARDGKVVYFQEHGYRYAEGREPMTKDTVFFLASMTKPFTVVALMILFEEGYFQLDDPISKWFPEYADMQVAVPDPSSPGGRKLVPAARPITIRQCVTHTAGLPGMGFGGGGEGWPATVAEAIRQEAPKQPLRFQPGESWDYSSGITIAGALVELMSGMNLEEFMKARIFEPLGMHDTFFNVPEDKVDRRAALYRVSQGGAPRTQGKPRYRPPTTFFNGSGALYTTAPDFFRFAQMILNGGELDGARILGRKTVELMITNQTGNLLIDKKGPGYGFGLGWSIILDPGKTIEPLSPGTFSWGGAAGTYFWIDPAESMIAIFMTQLMPHQGVFWNVFSVMVPQAVVDSHRGRVPTIQGYQPILRDDRIAVGEAMVRQAISEKLRPEDVERFRELQRRPPTPE